MSPSLDGFSCIGQRLDSRGQSIGLEFDGAFQCLLLDSSESKQPVTKVLSAITPLFLTKSLYFNPTRLSDCFWIDLSFSEAQ